MKKNNIFFIYTTWIAIIVLVFSFVFYLNHFEIFKNFTTRIEQNTFDARQNIISKYKKHNDNIVIISIDDASYEYIMDKYGSWPISRKTWADVINEIEKVKPKSIILDLLFLKPALNDKNADKALVQTAKKYDNIYFSMNFDNYSEEIRKSPILEENLELKIRSGKISNDRLISFANARNVMPDLSKATNNIASTNIIRDENGIIRSIPPVYKYKNKYYPNLTLLAVLNLLGQNGIEVKNNTIIIDNNHKIPLDKKGCAILNWYGKSNTFQHISLWEVLKNQKENNYKFIKDNFKDKIVYIGTTTTSLSDVKSIPIDYHFSGVEIQATFLNNILDNNFIRKIPTSIDFLLSLIFCLIVGFYIIRTNEVAKTIIFLFISLFTYILSAIIVMHKFNLWIGIALPFVLSISTFIIIYIEKYLLKSRDYEQTYKLAVTDGLTQLYNHRYFQEQMILAVNNYHRYGNKFSLIMIDIDYFKKFNDNYGHQSGDYVLKQVANIIKKNSRTSDIACRYGGEEMTIILTNTNKEEAILTANKICTAVRESEFKLQGDQKVKVTVSIGVATVGVDGNKAQEIIEYSDKYLYKAKNNGRNQVVSGI